MTDLRPLVGHHVLVTGESGGVPFSVPATVVQASPTIYRLVPDAGVPCGHLICGPDTCWRVTDLPEETPNV
ncbi:hypothetical protein [Allonocardiopsis opalescens]|uniref:Uncharacterized protein n=1 Tax=Allonocardiopsis opalescens TaxID=1144618 RepID=A0A2T0PP57_9ACTN|nr:hypothetical protein [Allonocardiopsis opalescens]PRX90689.1 hypothetical protein CLV72_11827 [Allonocardiopsis opalescens]